MSTHAAVHDPRNAEVLVSINGEFFPREEAKISVFDSGYLVGDGVWEGLRLHHGKLAFLDRHLDRLFANAAAIDLDLGMSRPDVAALLYETVERNEMHDAVHVRLMVTRGDKKTPSQHPSNLVGGPNVVVIAEHKTADPDVTGRGVTLHTAQTRRPGPDVLDQRLNCHSKLHEVIALIEATKAGADEALMLDVNGHVATCNATNFFIVRGAEVWTSTGEYCLNGITRGMVIEIGRSEGIPVLTKNFDLEQVHTADEAFVTGTFGGLTPVTRIDGRTIGTGVVPGPMTARLAALYVAAVEADVR
ncbi:MAG: aminotransferase class IV [Acidimicrobiia bacterium]